MRSFIRSLVLGLSVSLLVACGGGGPVPKALAHQKAMLTIVDNNKTDAKKAADELQKYVDANKAELEQIKGEMDKLKAEVKDDMSKAMTIMNDNKDAFQEVQELKKKLREEAKEVMADEKVSELLRSVRGM